MNIDSYSFGRIVIDGRAFVSDLIIFPDRLESGWRRKESHRLLPADLEEAAAAAPQAVVIGTGIWGRMKVPGETLEFLESRGIEVHVARSGRAVGIFNRLRSAKRTVACLHLTC